MNREVRAQSMEIDKLIARVDRIPWSDHDGRIAALTALIERPEVGSVDVPGVWDEIHQHHRALGRFEEAIVAKRAAIAAGYRSTPDPEADIAEIYVEQGSADAAADLYAELRARKPDDVWLYNSAAWAYASVDPAESLRWALAGIDIAFATGDPDRVIGDLRGHATRAWTALDLAGDLDLLQRIDAFIDSQIPRRSSPTPAASPVPSGLSVGSRDALRSAPVPVGFSWFPATEWALATQRWPALLDDFPADHQAYCRALEAKLKAFRQHTPGLILHVSPITVDELTTYSAERGNDPGTGEARSDLAANVLRTGRATPWPPARNERCWCGSGRKYKQCCGPTPPAQLEDAAE